MHEFSAQFTQNYILYFILPFWFIVGFADYLCHRLTRIEATSGLKESLIHALMFVEITLPVVLGLYLEITSLVMIAILAAYFLHEATAIWDISYAQERREIWVVEQHIHSYLAVIPFMVASFVICLHWNDFVGLFGIGDAQPDFSIRWKERPLPVAYHVGLNIAAAAFLGFPYVEELWRCYRYQRQHGVPPKADRVIG